MYSLISTIKIVDLGVKGSCLERGRGGSIYVFFKPWNDLKKQIQARKYFLFRVDFSFLGGFKAVYELVKVFMLFSKCFELKISWKLIFI